MNAWMKRTAGVVMISGAIVAGAAPAAFATGGGEDDPSTTTTWDFSVDNVEQNQNQSADQVFTQEGDGSIDDFESKNENNFAEQNQNAGATFGDDASFGSKFVYKVKKGKNK